jgi:peptide deformylase
VIDSTQIFANLDPHDLGKFPDEPGIKQLFINAHIRRLNGEEWAYNEGCLSIPKIREDILRNEEVQLEFMDREFKLQVRTFSGLTARVILHEYDHIEGKLFIDRISALKRKLMKGKLDDISKGKVKVDYKMTFSK